MTNRSAVRVAPAFADPTAVRAAIEAAGPYWPLVRYAASPAERSALGAGGQPVLVPPWFRLDFALGGTALVEGADAILGNRRFVDAARAVFGATAVVRPTTVYVNVMAPAPMLFEPHTDVPAFSGFTRDDHPVWLLHVMHRSGLFEGRRTQIATAVAWFYDGPGGAFHYWPDGPDADERVEAPPFTNVAVVADNERTFHGVASLGASDTALPDHLTLDSDASHDDDGWQVRTPGATTLAYDDNEVRLTVSWKAEVYRDENEARRADAGEDALDLDRVVRTLLEDLRTRGVEVDDPNDPHADHAWMAALGATYPRHPPRIGSTGSAVPGRSSPRSRAV